METSVSQYSHLCFLGSEASASAWPNLVANGVSFPSRIRDGRGWSGDFAAAGGPGESLRALGLFRDMLSNINKLKNDLRHMEMRIK